MDRELKQSMLTYYDERASEYDEIYTLGKGSTTIDDPFAYKKETLRLKQIVNDICAGDILDIPSGTAFWLPSYAQHCTTALLVDQSESMLEESQLRAQQHGIHDRCRFLQSDIFAIEWPRHQFDVALVGFFISHLTEEEEKIFLSNIREALKPGGKFLVLDSAWSQERAKKGKKEGVQVRKLKNGTEFSIYKKYFDIQDIESLGDTHHVHIEICHFGRAFCAFSGT